MEEASGNLRKFGEASRRAAQRYYEQLAQASAPDQRRMMGSLSNIYEPTWNYSTTTSGSTTTVIPTYQKTFVVESPLPAAAPIPPPVDGSALGWLRGRVQEICDAGALM